MSRDTVEAYAAASNEGDLEALKLAGGELVRDTPVKLPP